MRILKSILGVLLSVSLTITPVSVLIADTAQAAGNLGEVQVFLTQQYGTWYEEQEPLAFYKTNPGQQGSIIQVYPDREGQTFLGIGGAMTESAAYNLSKLSVSAQGQGVSPGCTAFCGAMGTARMDEKERRQTRTDGDCGTELRR